jgi:preprotein translocase subunit SecB
MNKPEFQPKIKLDAFFIVEVNYNAMVPVPTETSTTEDKFDLKIGYDLNFEDKSDSKVYSVTFSVEIKNTEEGFNLKVSSVAVFSTPDFITDEFKTSTLVLQNSPAIAFPFLRSFIATLTTNTGISGPFLLPTINLTKLKDQPPSV